MTPAHPRIQLAEIFRARITDGTWKPGQKIPSVRDLAIEASTNPNTVQRALAALDEEGLTVPKRTAGRFVATDDAPCTPYVKPMLKPQ